MCVCKMESALHSKFDLCIDDLKFLKGLYNTQKKTKVLLHFLPKSELIHSVFIL